MIKVSLDANDFQCLVSGGILTINCDIPEHQIQIILKDIGFLVMDHCITQVDTGKVPPYSNLERQHGCSDKLLNEFL